MRNVRAGGNGFVEGGHRLEPLYAINYWNNVSNSKDKL